MAEAPASSSRSPVKAAIWKAKQEETLASMQQGQKPIARPSRAELNKRLQGMKADAHRGQQYPHQERLYIVKSAYAPSVTPVAQLSTIALSDLLLETHHRRKLLVIRIVADAVDYLGVHSIAQDAAGDIDHISLHFQNPQTAPSLAWFCPRVPCSL
ncbi:hypothetical protein LTR37_001398 [Vermiconidia calcicola]|uniref:Uncharacterized protein n=1 Tax=Vermiconidia calcicola TaxID=1690605 RepID=A0ACC3NVM0_9PEZI|nr:hypothetical protein LTR37_001398 [Vermiconidia calcicola]